MNNKGQPRQRHLNWAGCHNTRDLGGLLTTDGRETRWGRVIRSDLLGRLTEPGRRALLDYGARTIIDLRPPQETQKEPSIFTTSTTPTGNANEPIYLNLPLEKYYPHVSALISKAESRAEVYCIILDHYPDAVADIMRAIVNAQPGGVVIHCHAGQDRTGIVSALLLRLAGIPVETIAADYAESQTRLRPLYEKSGAEAGGEDMADFWLKPTATADMMETMLAHLERTYGGVERYSLDEVGLSSAEVERLKKRLCPQEETD